MPCLHTSRPSLPYTTDPSNPAHTPHSPASDLFEGDGDSADGMVVRSALQSREHGRVDPALQVVHDLLTLLIHRADAATEEDEARPVQHRVTGHGQRSRGA